MTPSPALEPGFYFIVEVADKELSHGGNDIMLSPAAPEKPPEGARLLFQAARTACTAA